MNPLRKLYRSFLGLAEKKYASWILGAVAFFESFVFPVPPDVLLLPVSLGKPSRAFRFALICSVFSVLGACAGYFLGRFFWDLAAGWFYSYGIFTAEQFTRAGELFNDNAFYTLLVAAFSPIPFKVFTIASGVFNVGLGVLVVGSAIGRSARFFLVAALVWKFGGKAKDFIDRYFNLLTALFALVLVGLFVLIRVKG